jgi:hypothetical protein
MLVLVPRLGQHCSMDVIVTLHTSTVRQGRAASLSSWTISACLSKIGDHLATPYGHLPLLHRYDVPFAPERRCWNHGHVAKHLQ